MYSSTIASIAFGRKYSEAIEKTAGLKQGHPLSATLFDVYINDFPLILEKNTALSKSSLANNPSHFPAICGRLSPHRNRNSDEHKYLL